MLVDTSVWVDHLRHDNEKLGHMLDEGVVWCHPFVVGELACGNLRNRDRILTALQSLPTSTAASHDEVLHLLDRHQLFGRGLGWIDAHLLCSALLSRMSLWTFDSSLGGAAGQLGIAADV